MKKLVVILILIGLFFSPIRVFAVDSSDNSGDNSGELLGNAVSGVLIEANSGKIIYKKDMDKQVAVASMTKMVAQILILEAIERGDIKWSDVITVSKNAAEMGGSQIYIEEGEKITVEDLMKGISMASGNDATVQMAEVIGGSETEFVKLMNKKVQQLGLKNTHFSNCTGLDEENHYSSAYDMAMIARELVVNHPEILSFSSVYEDYLRENTENKFWLVNTNKLVRFYEGADGLKTGHTDAAGYCLAATAKKGDLRLIGIVLGEENGKIRNSETMALLDYGFANVKMNVLRNKGTTIKKIKIDKADKDIVSIVLKNNLGVVEEPSAKKKYEYDINIDNFSLPKKKGDVVGRISVLYKDEVVATEDLVVKNDVKPLSYLRLFYNGLLDIISGTI